jgi:hypothetical protein
LTATEDRPIVPLDFGVYEPLGIFAVPLVKQIGERL